MYLSRSLLPRAICFAIFPSLRAAATQGITAIAADPVSGYPPRLAVALKAGKRLVRVMLYELLRGSAAALPRGATAMCTGQVELTEALSVKVPPFSISIPFIRTGACSSGPSRPIDNRTGSCSINLHQGAAPAMHELLHDQIQAIINIFRYPYLSGKLCYSRMTRLHQWVILFIHYHVVQAFLHS